MIMKQFSLKRLALCAVALLTSGVASAAVETYDFKTMANTLGDTNEHYPAYDGTRIFNVQNSNWIDIQKMSYDDFGLNNRFAAEARNSSGFNLRKSGDWVGLNSGYAAVRYFSILGLEAGDKVTITYDQGALYNYNRDGSAANGLTDGDAVVSGTEYTITATGRFDIKTGETKVNITKVVIETSVATETIHIGKRTKTYNFESIANNTAFANTTNNSSLATADNNFDNRFALGRYDNGCKFGGSGYGLQIWYSNRTFTIKNMAVGDKFTLTFALVNTQTLVFNAPTKVGLTDETKTLVSGTTYTVAEAGDIVISTTDNTEANRANIKNVTIIDTDASIKAGTLVSSTALDFTSTSVSAYYASEASAGTVTLTPITKVAAGTPIYYKADAAGFYEIPALNDNADATTGNLLKGLASATTSLQSTDAIKYYVFGVKNGVSGFYPVSTSSNLTSAAGKAYLQLTTEQAAAAPILWLNFDDNNNTTGIMETKALKADGIFYNLAGQRVDNPTKGLYIVNGRKVVIK